MHKLVFNDVRDPTIRADILTHIQREASVQIAHMRLGTKRGRNRKQQAWRKVLSDVDDTLYSSGGRYPAGLDTRYPRHTLYPGVLPFYRELDMGTVGPDDWTDDRVGNLVFLSARPHVYKDVSEKKSYAKFAALHEKMGMHTLPTMLAGNLKSGRAFMWQGDLEPMAQKKFENFSEFYQLYPEFKHILSVTTARAMYAPLSLSWRSLARMHWRLRFSSACSQWRRCSTTIRRRTWSVGAR